MPAALACPERVEEEEEEGWADLGKKKEKGNTSEGKKKNDFLLFP